MRTADGVYQNFSDRLAVRYWGDEIEVCVREDFDMERMGATKAGLAMGMCRLTEKEQNQDGNDGDGEEDRLYGEPEDTEEGN